MAFSVKNYFFFVNMLLGPFIGIFPRKSMHNHTGSIQEFFITLCQAYDYLLVEFDLITTKQHLPKKHSVSGQSLVP